MWSVWVNSYIIYIPTGRVFIPQKVPFKRISMNRFIDRLIYIHIVILRIVRIVNLKIKSHTKYIVNN